MKSYIENGNVDPPSSSAEITFNITNTSGSSISCSGRMGVILSGAGFIHPIDKKEYTYYVLIFGDDNIEKLTIKFYSLEDAIGFGIYAVRKCFMYYDIAMAYKERCIAGKFKTLEGLKEKTKQKVKK